MEDVGAYEGGFIQYSYKGISLVTPISVTIASCQVEKFKFESPIVYI